MPLKVVLVDGVGNGAVHQIPNKALPVNLMAAGREFVRTGEAVTELPVFRLQGTHVRNRPHIRHVGAYVPPREAAA